MRACDARAIDDDPAGDHVVVTTISARRTWLELDGEFDAEDTPLITSATAHLRGAEHHDVVVDAGRVTFASSSLLNVLLQLRIDLVERGGRVIIVRASPAVQRVLEITSCAEFFTERPRA